MQRKLFSCLTDNLAHPVLLIESTSKNVNFDQRWRIRKVIRAGFRRSPVFGDRTSYIHKILKRNSKTKSLVLIKSVKTKFSCTYRVWKLAFSQYLLTVSSTDENQVMFSLECIKKNPNKHLTSRELCKCCDEGGNCNLEIVTITYCERLLRQKFAHRAVSWGPSHSQSLRL